MRYIRVKSVTWWAGALAMALGLILAAGPPALGLAPDQSSGLLTALAQALTALTGGSDASPAGLIIAGLGLIGVRDKMEREAAAAQQRHFEGMNYAAAADEFGVDDDDQRLAVNFADESPMPPDVVDPYGPEGSR